MVQVQKARVNTEETIITIFLRTYEISTYLMVLSSLCHIETTEILEHYVLNFGEFHPDEYVLIPICACSLRITVSLSCQTKFPNVPLSLSFTKRFEGE